jgi:hypothetical protein
MRDLSVALLRTVWVYTSVAFVYVAVTAVLRPRQLGQRLWHGLSWPHKDTFGAIAFVVSFACFIFLSLLDERPFRFWLRSGPPESSEAS